MSVLLDIRDLVVHCGAVEAVVGQAASRVAVMRAGQVVESGPCARLLTTPEHACTKSLLAAVPTLRTDREKPLAMVAN